MAAAAAAAAASRVLAATRLLVVAACAVLIIGGAEAEPWRVHGGGGGGTCFTRLFSFGDSITDNGNWMHYARSPGAVARPPYGETFFRRPNGRFCDGRIIIDHIADALRIPFVTPYLAGNKSGDYLHGANFAVGGATALGREYFRRKKLDARFTPYSLRWQMRWLRKVLAMLSSSSSSEHQGTVTTTEWSDLMASSLFLVGEIGGNDYNQALFQGRSIDEVKTYVPDVVAAIAAALTDLIGLGATTVVVPGNFPTGCNPGYLAQFATNDTAEYDAATGCLRWPNDLSELHNRALRAELAQLRRRHPGVNLVYADYFAAAMDITAHPRKHGFGGHPLVSCCGAGGGPYNTNLTVTAHCGASSSTTCRSPYEAVSWDGFHFTDHAYQVIAHGVLRGPFAAPPLHLAKCGSEP